MAVSQSTLRRTTVDVIGAANGDQSAQVRSTNGHDCSHTGVSGRTAANFPAHLRTHRLARRGGDAARASGQLTRPLCSLRTSICNAHVCACASPAFAAPLCSGSSLQDYASTYNAFFLPALPGVPHRFLLRAAATGAASGSPSSLALPASRPTPQGCAASPLLAGAAPSLAPPSSSETFASSSESTAYCGRAPRFRWEVRTACYEP